MATAATLYARMNELDTINTKTKTRKYPHTFRTSMINNNNSNTNSNINNVNSNKKSAGLSSNSSSALDSYSLADIYEDAAVIGSELEKIIINHGPELLKDLMPKVINVLELLENLTIKNEQENEELNELKIKVSYLEAEKYQKINEREKFEKVSVFATF